MKKMVVFLLILSLFSCGKGKKGPEPKEDKFKNGFVSLKTYYYKQPSLKSAGNYKGTVKRGQKIELSDETRVLEKDGVKHYFTKCKLPGEDDVYWVRSKYEFKGGYKRSHVYARKLKIAVVNKKEAYYYSLPDTNSKQYDIKGGIKVFIIEEKRNWSKVNILVSESGLRDKNMWMQNAHLSPESTANVKIEMVKYIEDLGKISLTSSSTYIGAIGSERRHTADMAFDGKKSTAWIEGVKGQGRGEWIKIEFKSGMQKFNLSIINGYAANKKLYKINSRVRKIKIETDTQTKTVELKDNNLSFQYLGTFEGSFAKLTIEDVYKGKDPDTTISEILIKKGEGTPPAETENENKSGTSGLKPEDNSGNSGTGN